MNKPTQEEVEEEEKDMPFDDLEDILDKDDVDQKPEDNTNQQNSNLLESTS